MYLKKEFFLIYNTGGSTFLIEFGQEFVFSMSSKHEYMTGNEDINIHSE